jgi:3-hydroxyacyl-CoA dehydrogenase/enoyl-CoA hydratase/3-hydroxybutyryl-CoA epimerase
MQEKVVESTAEANLGSIYGWGFPKEKGGVIRFIYDYTKAAFQERAKAYQQELGQRFRVPKILRELPTEPPAKVTKATVD